MLGAINQEDEDCQSSSHLLWANHAHLRSSATLSKRQFVCTENVFQSLVNCYRVEQRRCGRSLHEYFNQSNGQFWEVEDMAEKTRVFCWCCHLSTAACKIHVGWLVLFLTSCALLSKNGRIIFVIFRIFANFLTYYDNFWQLQVAIPPQTPRKAQNSIRATSFRPELFASARSFSREAHRSEYFWLALSYS